MTIKASGRSALILATGLIVGLAGPSQAATEACRCSNRNGGSPCGTPRETAQLHQTRLASWKKPAQHKVAQKSAAAENTADAADDDGDNSPRSILRDPALGRQRQRATGRSRYAGRQRQGHDGAGQQHRAEHGGAPVDAQPADTPVVAADQLNDVDRALHESTPPSGTMATASAEPPAAAAPGCEQPKTPPGTRLP